VTYLLDNDISFRFAQMLAALGVDVVAVREVEDLGEGAPDVGILQWLKGRERVFVTADKHIRSRPAEIAALSASGVTALFLERFWAKLDFWQQAAWLVGRWPQIDQFASSASPGTCATIQQRGRIRLL
jgi:predicted nuclease of predicted toxin-antitoxin system